MRQITEGLDLGVEATGAVTKELQLGKGLLQFQIGGNYRVKEGLSLDFGIIGGQYPASPRAGLQLGFTVDF